MSRIIKKLEVKLEGEVFSRQYSIENIEFVVDLINELFYNEINIKIVDVKEKRLV